MASSLAGYSQQKRTTNTPSVLNTAVMCWIITTPHILWQPLLSGFTCHGERLGQSGSVASSGPGLEQCWPGSAGWFCPRSSGGMTAGSCWLVGGAYKCSVQWKQAVRDSFQAKEVNYSPQYCFFRLCTLLWGFPRLCLSLYYTFKMAQRGRRSAFQQATNRQGARRRCTVKCYPD